MGAMRSFVVAVVWLMQRLMFAAVALLGLGLLGYTLACAFGYAPWLEMTATFGGVAYPEAGLVVQIGVTALMLGLCFFLPANARMMALETSHRRFQIAMEDVARAYRLSHASTATACSRCALNLIRSANACLSCAITRIWQNSNLRFSKWPAR